MVTRQKTKSDTKPNLTTKASLWLSVLLVVISFTSLSLVFSSFPSTAFASISSPSLASSGSLTQPYNLNVSSNITTIAGQPPKVSPEQTSNTIPSPAPLSLVALLLLVLASAIRRHQNQA